MRGLGILLLRCGGQRMVRAGNLLRRRELSVCGGWLRYHANAGARDSSGPGGQSISPDSVEGQASFHGPLSSMERTRQVARFPLHHQEASSSGRRPDLRSGGTG